MPADDDGHVIVSLLVNSERPIAELEPFRHVRPREEADDDLLYVLLERSFDEPAWERRADLLDAAVTTAIDTLIGSGVDLALLASPSVFVRAYFTFPAGSETISAEAVQRLASINATLWIDFLP